MALARAFTTRRNKHVQPDFEISMPLHVGRAASQRAGRPVLRNLISSPVALVSTSNALLNNATAIAGTAPIENRAFSSGSSVSSGDDSDSAPGSSIHSSRDTITDASSIGDSPSSPEPEPNHLSCYFKPAVDTQSGSPPASARPSLDAPSLPKRVPSHSKKAHETLARKRSVQRIMSPPPTTAREASTSRASVDMFSPFDSANTSPAFVEAPKENPFGNELAQLDEVAEELGQVVRDATTAANEADAAYMEANNLAAFGAVDYTNMIQSLLVDTFYGENDLGGWI